MKQEREGLRLHGQVEAMLCSSRTRWTGLSCGYRLFSEIINRHDYGTHSTLIEGERASEYTDRGGKTDLKPRLLRSINITVRYNGSNRRLANDVSRWIWDFCRIHAARNPFVFTAVKQLGLILPRVTDLRAREAALCSYPSDQRPTSRQC